MRINITLESYFNLQIFQLSNYQIMLLSVTSDTWIVTGLGFGIVLALLFCLVFILMGFGWIMQRVSAPKAQKKAPQAAPAAQPAAQTPTVQTPADDDVNAAIAMALYLSSAQRHDLPTAIMHPQARNTAWNAKELGLNNKGF